MDKLEFTNRNLENLNRCIAENGKVELMKFTELTNRLFDAINYTSCSTEFFCEDEDLGRQKSKCDKQCASCNWIEHR